LPARHPVGGGVGAAVGATVGSGVAPGLAETIRIQPTSSVFGSVSSEGYDDPFQAWSWATLVPHARAMDESVSPPRTVYRVPTSGADGEGGRDSLAPGELEPAGVALADGPSLAGTLGVGLADGLQAEISRRTATPAARRRMVMAISWGGSAGRPG
jgi:hypothetical protein